MTRFLTTLGFLILCQISLSQVKFANEFTVSNDFIEATQRTYITELYDAVSYTDLSKNDKKEVFNRLRENTKLFKKRGSVGFDENLVINKTKLPPSWDLLDGLNANFERIADKVLPSDMSMEKIDSGISNFKGYTYVFFTSLIRMPDFERFTSQYIISVNNINYMIVVNSFKNLSFSDVITDIKKE